MTALTPQAIHAYLQNTKRRVSMADLSRTQGVNRSTITRRIQRVEDIRENPEVDAILAAITPSDLPPTPADLARDLGVKVEEVHATASRGFPRLVLSPGQILVGDADLAAIYLDGTTPQPLPCPHALYMLAVGWVAPAGTASGGAIRVYKATPSYPSRIVDPPEALSIPTRPVAFAPGEGALGRLIRTSPDLFAEDHSAIGLEYQAALAFPNGEGGRIIRRAVEVMPPLMVAVLDHIVGGNGNIEDFERANGLPARSGKVTLRLALDALRPIVGAA